MENKNSVRWERFAKAKEKSLHWVQNWANQRIHKQNPVRWIRVGENAWELQ